MPIRNFVHRRNHKERSQPTHRARKFGLLEKHKDYVQRARDHHSKRDRIKRLREKALDRNKDEYYFGMVKGRTEKGVHIQSRGNESLPTSVVSLLKTQDVGYVRRQVTQERKRIEALVGQLAPNVPEMRVEWLQEKESRTVALKEAGLLGAAQDKGRRKRVARELELNEEMGEGKVGSQGKRTVWLDGVDQVRGYSAPSTSSVTLDAAAPTDDEDESTGRPKHRSIEDYDLEDIDEDVLIDDGELSDSDEEDEEESEDEARRRPTSSSTSPTSVKKQARHLQKLAEDRRRSREKHWSYLISLLRARQVRLHALLQASTRLGLVRALMATKGGTSVSKHKSSAQEAALREAVASGKVSKHGLAMPGNEEEDEEEDVNGRRDTRQKVVFKFGKERKR
ncbi:Utp11-domain-containing protein [Microstroma glucosiphilum]|uniref:Utp11-domain-containing protein n=1 Tax=Pseudomicrostroma glucosiphilum TaxID=1684307 RepID=A0A316U3U3_9BASI|nr:Utp11-domain-containing protein [Pseudomicrostroma glucosiphilum]PWN19464.1 Utp11-domain-containing protein [Pseudomicrostroma glucosiphilum]